MQIQSHNQYSVVKFIVYYDGIYSVVKFMVCCVSCCVMAWVLETIMTYKCWLA